MLHRHFALRRFLPGQREALEGILAGRDVIAVLPTGGGKTLIYQLAGLLLGGTTVVATPLLALMQDQVRRLREVAGDAGRVAQISSAVRGEERDRLLRELAGGGYDVVFATPEQLARDDVRAALRHADVRLLCIDEAHCISEWGFDFRPAYRELAASAALMGRPPVLALTATAPEAVRHDIVAELGLVDPLVVARGFDRPNLSFAVVRVTDADRRDRQLAKVLAAAEPGAKLVYCSTRREAEETALALLGLGLAAGHYHGRMERALRAEVQAAFLAGDLEVLCATSAFGMGIDKPDIRAVVHRTMPSSVEAYWQEAGRAGRDGGPADCVLLHRPEDRAVHEHLHRRSRPSEATVARMVHVVSQVRTPTAEADVAALVAEAADVARSGATTLVEDLDRFGHLERGVDGVRFVGDPAVAMERLVAHQAVQVDVEQSRLGMVEAYAEATTCRRRFLLNYLGDDYPADLCLRCDECLRRAGTRGPDDWDLEVQRERVAVRSGGPFAPTDQVVHHSWGAGVVQRVDGDTVVVRFDTVGYKSMHAPTVRARGLLAPA